MSVPAALRALAAALGALALVPSPHPAPTSVQWVALVAHAHSVVGRAAILCAPPAPPASAALVDTLATALHDLLGGGLALARAALVGETLLARLGHLVAACEAWLLALAEGNDGNERIAQCTGAVWSALDQLRDTPVSVREAALAAIRTSTGAVKDACTELAESAEDDAEASDDSDTPHVPRHLLALTDASLQLLRLADMALTRLQLVVKDAQYERDQGDAWLAELARDTHALSALVDDLVCALYDDDSSEDLFISTRAKISALLAAGRGSEGVDVSDAHTEMLTLLSAKLDVLAVPDARTQGADA